MTAITFDTRQNNPMHTETVNPGHSLYVLYETLSSEMQQAFLQELLQKQQDKLDDLAFYLACQQTREENDFLDDEEAHAFMSKLPR